MTNLDTLFNFVLMSFFPNKNQQEQRLQMTMLDTNRILLVPPLTRGQEIVQDHHVVRT